jgi:hypothetical protein
MRLRQGINAGLAIPAIDRDVVAPIAKPNALGVRAPKAASGAVKIPR